VSHRVSGYRLGIGADSRVTVKPTVRGCIWREREERAPKGLNVRRAGGLLELSLAPRHTRHVTLAGSHGAEG
jgi:hypothetical protein